MRRFPAASHQVHPPVAAALCSRDATIRTMYAVLTQWEVSPFQPSIPEGGRADTIAVHPLEDDIIFVASSTGGLFRSGDRGLHWKHVDSLPAYGNAVAFLPADPDILIATARPDFHTANYGGIWRSLDAMPGS
jgi:hypothetical protein